MSKVFSGKASITVAATISLDVPSASAAVTMSFTLEAKHNLIELENLGNTLILS